MKFVKQQHPTGCAVASLAMVTDRTYEQVMKDAREMFHGGLKDGDISTYLSNRGKFVRSMGRYDPEEMAYRMLWPPDPFARRHLAKVVRDIHVNTTHVVAVNIHGLVFDPLGDGPGGALDDYPRVLWVMGIK